MAEEIASLYATIGADISGLSKALGSATKQLGDFGKDLTAGLTLPIVGFATAAIKAFSDSETGIAQLNAVLKSTKGIAGVTAKSALDLANALQKVTRYSDDDVLSGENLLLTFTNIGKDVFPDATKAMLDMSTAMGQDLKTSAIQIGKALQDPIRGVTALRRVGVNFTASQEKMIKRLVESGHVMDAQKLILKELKTEFGGSAEAAGNTLAGAIDKLKNAFGDLLKGPGGQLSAVLKPMIESLTKFVISLKDANPEIIKLAVYAGLALAAIGPMASILSAVAGVVGFLVSPIGLLVAGIGLLAAAFITNFGGIRDTLTPILDFVKNTISQLVQNIRNGIDWLQKGGSLSDVLSAWLMQLEDWVGGIVAKVGPQLVTAFSGLWAKVSDWIANSAWPAVQNAVQTFFDSVRDFFANGGATRLTDGIINALKQVGAWIRDHGWETVQEGVTNLFNSLSKFFSEHKVIDLVKNIGDAVIAAANWIITDGIPRFAAAFEQLKREIGKIISKIGEDMINSVKSAIGAIKSLGGGGGSSAPPLPNRFGIGPVGMGLDLLGKALGFAGGGPTPSVPTLATVGERGQEYVVPKGGALVSGGGGPQVIHLIADFGDAVQHIYFNVGEAINRGNAMPLRRMS